MLGRDGLEGRSLNDDIDLLCTRAEEVSFCSSAGRMEIITARTISSLDASAAAGCLGRSTEIATALTVTFIIGFGGTCVGHYTGFSWACIRTDQQAA